MQRPEECLSKKNGWISGVKALLHFSLIYFHVLNPSSTVAWQKLPKIVLKHQQSHSHWRGLNRVKAPSKSYSWRIVIIWLPGSSLEDPSHKDVFVWPDRSMKSSPHGHFSVKYIPQAVYIQLLYLEITQFTLQFKRNYLWEVWDRSVFQKSLCSLLNVQMKAEGWLSIIT